MNKKDIFNLKGRYYGVGEMVFLKEVFMFEDFFFYIFILTCWVIIVGNKVEFISGNCVDFMIIFFILKVIYFFLLIYGFEM